MKNSKDSIPLRNKKNSLSWVVDITIPETKWNALSASFCAKMWKVLSSDSISHS